MQVGDMIEDDEIPSKSNFTRIIHALASYNYSEIDP